MARRDPVRLKEAPALLFADEWARLVALKGGAEQAQEIMAHPDPGFLTFRRRELLESNFGEPSHRAAALVAEEVDALVNKLRADLLILGAEGRIAAFGLYAGTGIRQPIPADLWPAATLDFAADRLTSNSFAYHFVTVELAGQSLHVESVLVAMRAWLVQRREKHGVELKKVLQDAAREAFGEGFRVRAFNSAYAATYKRTRGRPEK